MRLAATGGAAASSAHCEPIGVLLHGALEGSASNQYVLRALSSSSGLFFNTSSSV
jgi:hypothetical protein